MMVVGSLIIYIKEWSREEELNSKRGGGGFVPQGGSCSGDGWVGRNPLPVLLYLDSETLPK